MPQWSRIEIWPREGPTPSESGQDKPRPLEVLYCENSEPAYETLVLTNHRLLARCIREGFRIYRDGTEVEALSLKETPTC